MKKYFVFLLLAYVSFLKAQYNDPYQYYPMATGNYWYYSGGPDYYYSEQVFADSIDNSGNRFFWMDVKHTGDRPDRGIDTNYFYILDPKNTLGNAEYKYKLNAEIGDWWWVFRRDSTDMNTGVWCKLLSVNDGTYLGIKTRLKTYAFYYRIKNNNVYYDFHDHNETLAYGMGMIYRDNDAAYPFDLIGAIIDRKKIGTPVDVKEDLTKKIPDDFELYQNYPNPFNPSTTINYHLPQNSFVTIKVYDVLGREVATLVNDYRPAGYYSVEFNASSGGRLPSGIYIYTITANNPSLYQNDGGQVRSGQVYTQSKKMLLIK